MIGDKFLIRGLLISLLALGFTACSDDDDDNANPNPTPSAATVFEAIENDTSLSTLKDAIEAAGLETTLEGAGPFTIFAPTNAAFDLLPSGLIDGLTTEELTDVLENHVVSGSKLEASDVTAASSATTLEGDVSIMVVGSTVVLDGRVQVTQTDVQADNGVVHIIDAVLIPGDFPGNLVQALSSYPRFSELVGAVGTASLVSTLEGDNGGDGFTVLAPSDDAFDGVTLPSDSGDLADLLTYHVLPTTEDSSAVSTAADGNQDLETVEGSDITLSKSGDDIMINGEATITAVDINASNGVIHVIDTVLTIP